MSAYCSLLKNWPACLPAPLRFHWYVLTLFCLRFTEDSQKFAQNWVWKFKGRLKKEYNENWSSIVIIWNETVKTSAVISADFGRASNRNDTLSLLYSIEIYYSFYFKQFRWRFQTVGARSAMSEYKGKKGVLLVFQFWIFWLLVKISSDEIVLCGHAYFSFFAIERTETIFNICCEKMVAFKDYIFIMCIVYSILVHVTKRKTRSWNGWRRGEQHIKCSCHVYT